MDGNWDGTERRNDVVGTLSSLRTDMKDLEIKMAEFTANCSSIREVVKELKEMMSDNKKTFVSKAEFTPVRLVVYGLVATTLVGVLTAALAIVIRKG